MANDDESLMCQGCGKRRATIHLTDFVDGAPEQTHLCEECYNQHEELPALSQKKIVAQIIGAIAPELGKVGMQECPECGITYLEFRQTLRLGCPHDYEVFAEPLDELLTEMHGANRHVGKVPHGEAQRDTTEMRHKLLQRELDQAVQEEDFARAAELRDQIQDLEQESARRTEE